MLGLQAPRVQSSLDDVLDIAEDVMKKFMFEFRKAALKELDDITRCEKLSHKESIRNIAKVKFQHFALVLKEPLTQVIKSIREDAAAIEPKRPLDANKVLYPLNGPRNLDGRVQSTPNVSREVKIVSTNERGLVISELKFNRLNDFVCYPKDVRGVEKLSVELDSQSISDNGLPHFSKILGMYTGCRQVMINLSTNQIGSAGMADLGSHLVSIRSLDKLWLGLYDNQIYDDGMKNFLNCYAKCQPYTTFTIDLRLNPIQKNLIDKLRTSIKHKKIVNFEIVS